MTDYTIQKVNNEFVIVANAANYGAFAHGHTISFQNAVTTDDVTVYVWRNGSEKVHEFKVPKNNIVNLTPPDRWDQKSYTLTTSPAVSCNLYTVVLDTANNAHPLYLSGKGGVYHQGDTVWIKNSRNSTVTATVYKGDESNNLLGWSTTTIPANGMVTGTIKNDAAGGTYKISFTSWTTVGKGGSGEGGHDGGNGDGPGPTTGDGEIRVGSGPGNGRGDDE